MFLTMRSVYSRSAKRMLPWRQRQQRGESAWRTHSQSSCWHSQRWSLISQSELPEDTVRSKCKPRLEDESNDASPVEYKAGRKVFFHIMPSNVINNERESVQKRENKKSIRYPSMEDLKLFVRNSSEERDPACFTRRCTVSRKYFGLNNERYTAYKINGIHAKPIHPDLVASAGELPYISSGQ